MLLLFGGGGRLTCWPIGGVPNGACPCGAPKPGDGGGPYPNYYGG